MAFELIATSGSLVACSASSISATVKLETPMWRASPSRLTFAQRAKRFRERDLRIGPVQQQQIDFAQAKLRQAFARRALEFTRRKMARPDFRGHEHVVALDAGSAQALAYFALVFVDFRGVDVPIAEPQRLLDHPRADPAAQFPGAEPKQAGCARLWPRQRVLGSNSLMRA